MDSIQFLHSKLDFLVVYVVHCSDVFMAYTPPIFDKCIHKQIYD